MQVSALHKLKGTKKTVTQKGYVTSFFPCAGFFPRVIGGRRFVFKYYILNAEHSNSQSKNQ